MFDEEHLITLVSNYKALFDKTNRYYDDKQVRDNMWKEIAEEIKQPEELCKKKWKYLRESYRKALKLRQGHSGDGGGKSIRPWKFEKLMQFLRPYVDDRKQTSNLSPNTEEDAAENTTDNESEDDNTEIINRPPTPASTTSSTPLRKKQRPNESSVAQVLGDYLNCKKKNEDPIDSFFTSLAQDVKQLPLPLQIRVKQEVLQSVSNAQLEAVSGYGGQASTHPEAPPEAAGSNSSGNTPLNNYSHYGEGYMYGYSPNYQNL